MRIWGDRFYHLSITSVFIVIGFSLGAIGFSSEALAQNSILPDNTLGDENSQITRETIRGIESDRISGGARRGQNLFHSFERFDIGEGLGAYFDNPEAVRNIFSRVTGSDPSDILGRLGVIQAGSSNVLGNANLFFINPNGILFGPNASLDLGGSFAATTANGMQFGDQGFFSATNPETPSQLLTIDPSAFFFNQLPVGNIIVRSIAPDVLGSNSLGLRVRNGEKLLLLSGDVSIDGGGVGAGLNAFEGRVDIGAVAGLGTIQLNPDGSLAFPEEIARGDVGVFNNALVDVALEKDGTISITTGNIRIIEGSLLLTGVFAESGIPESQAGDITLNATGEVHVEQSSIASLVAPNVSSNTGDIRITAGSLYVTDGARLYAGTLGRGNAGSVIIQATDRVRFEGVSNAYSNVEVGGDGQGGNIEITTPILEVLNGAQLYTGTLGRGNAGSVIIQATDQVRFEGTSVDGRFGSAAFSRVEAGSSGQGGNIEITTPILEVLNGAQLQASTSGQRNAGDIIIQATDRIRFEFGAALSSVAESGSGQGGDIAITTPILEVLDGAQLNAETFGRGNAGDIIIQATDRVRFEGVSGALSSVTESGDGQGGDIAITTPVLEVLNGAELNASTRGQGNAGNVNIFAIDRITIRGTSDDGRFGSGVFTTVAAPAVGNGGNINIVAGTLEVLDGAGLFTAISGLGNAGNVSINALERVTFRDGTVSTASQPSASGQAGNIYINTNLLKLTNGSQLITSTSGSGNAGNVSINALERVTFRDSAIFTTSQQGSIGEAGSIVINTNGVLEIVNGSQLITSTFSAGNSGDIIINATDRVLLDGIGADGLSSGLFTNTTPNSTGRGGIVRITVPTLRIADGAVINARTENDHLGGNVIIEVNRFTALNGGQVITTTVSSGQAGTITVNADRLNLDRGRISAESTGTGRAGDITLNLADRLQVNNGQILTSAEQASGGVITINAENADVRLSGRSDISTSVGSGAGSGGNIAVTAETIQLHDDSDIRTSVAGGQGDGGNITLRASSILAFDDSDIIAATPAGQGGDITLDTAAFFAEDFDPDAAEANPDELEDNDRADVNASGAQPGTITTPDTSLIQNSLTELPESAIDSDTLLANSCVVRSPDQSGTFTITGTGGLPQRPGDAPLPTYPTNSVRSTEESSGEPTWQMGDPIVEPEGLYLLEDGRMVLSRECR